MNAPDTVASTNPFPGLRPFHKDEEHLFFGREKQVDAMVDKLAETHFLAVVGTSGSGKSSLVNCGLRPALHRGRMPKAGTVWRIAQFRPGSNPIRAMAEALARDGVLYNGFESEDFSLAEIIESGLRTSKLGLITAFEQARLGPDVNLLVVADQFEELFRYHKVGASGSETAYGLDEEAKAFVNLLLEVCEHTSLPVHVVLTMRSDFLGDCAQFFGLPEAINAGQYLVPRMSRDDRRLAIVGPVGVGGAEIDPALATRLVNDVGDNPDQLSILQHALNRTWARWENQDGRQGPLELKHYEAIGTMAHALDQHAERAFAELDTERKQKICELIMKALTDWATDARGTRRPTKLGTLRVLAEATQAEVTDVIDVFRKPSRSFLMPPAQETLDEERVIDISHESLMRVWERLKTWGEEEARSAQMYRRLRDWALRWDKGDADLWRGPDLASAIAWREREAPRPQWAERYGSQDEFKLAMKFLDASEEAQRKAIAAEKEKRESELRRARRMAWGFGLLATILVVGILLYYVAELREFDTYYNSFVKVRGVPEGIGFLTADQVSHRALSYKITRRGRFGPVLRMEAVNSTGQPTIGSGVVSGFDETSTAVDLSQVQESRWEYVYDAKEKVAHEVSLDRFGRRVRSVTYAPSDSETGNTRTAYLIGRDGSLTPQQGSCQAFVTYDYSEKGYETLTHYRDQTGNPTPGRDNAISLLSDYDLKGNLVRVLSLWRDGSPMNDKMGNAEYRVSYDELGNPLTEEAFDAGKAPITLKAEGYFRLTHRYDEFGNEITRSYLDEFNNPVNIKDGWHRSEYRYDERGNVVEQTFWVADGSPGEDTNGCHRLKAKFDEFGNAIEMACLGADGQAKLVHPGFSVWRNAYDDRNRPIEWTYFDATENPVKGPEGAFRVRVRYDVDGNVVETAYLAPDGKPSVGLNGYHKESRQFLAGRDMRAEYLGLNGKPTLRKEGYAAIERGYDAQGNEIKVAYLDTDNQPVVRRDKGYAVMLSMFDSCGRAIETRFLDEKQHVVQPATYGYAIMRRAYDLDNHVSEETYFDPHERPVRLEDGYARLAQLWDKHGNLVDQRYFDENLESVRLENGYAEIKYRYDDHNGILQMAYFSDKGEPVVTREGWARIEYKNDDHGRNVERAHFGVRGEPVIDDETRCHRAKRKLDPRGNPLELEYFGTDGKPLEVTITDGARCAKIVQRFDAKNEVIDWECYDAAGHRAQ